MAFEQNDLLTAEPVLLVFNTLASAQAVAVNSGGLGAPQSRTTRGALGALVGGALGLGVAIMLGRLDRTIRTREQAEEVTGLRARVVIPEAKDDKQAISILSSGRHDSLSDAYRTLRNVIGFVHSSLPPEPRARITLVVSAGPGEGKTTLASNLAATFAETGLRTIAVNIDFRRPQLATRLADNPFETTAYTLDDLAWVEPDSLLRRTHVANLSLFDLGGLGSPDELARATASLMPRLAQSADAIVIDSSPVAATAEVLELVPMADVIIMVVRPGRTDMVAAQRTIATLRDLTTSPVVLVLVGLKQDATEYYYDYAERRQPNPEPAKAGKEAKGRRRVDRGTSDPPARPPAARSQSSPSRPSAQPARPSPDPLGRHLDLDEIDEFLRRQPPTQR